MWMACRTKFPLEDDFTIKAISIVERHSENLPAGPLYSYIFAQFLWISCPAESRRCPSPDSWPLTGRALWPLTQRLEGFQLPMFSPSGHTVIQYMHWRLQNRTETCMTSSNLIWIWQSRQQTSPGWKHIWAEENLLKGLTHYLQSVC